MIRLSFVAPFVDLVYRIVVKDEMGIDVLILPLGDLGKFHDGVVLGVEVGSGADQRIEVDSLGEVGDEESCGEDCACAFVHWVRVD